MFEFYDQVHLEPWQRVNHYRNDRELCRKDLLIKNVKRKKKGTRARKTIRRSRQGNPKCEATQRNAAQRKAVQRNATQRNAPQR